MKNIISLSGGKDSTAMLLMMLEKNEPIHSAVFFDTGWEFPEMIDHIDKLEKYTGLDFVRLKPKLSFTYELKEKPVKKRFGKDKGLIHRRGQGWPSIMRRWCTGRKINEIQRYYKIQFDFISCIGFAADEAKRVPVISKKKWPERYPLIEWVSLKKRLYNTVMIMALIGVGFMICLAGCPAFVVHYSELESCGTLENTSLNYGKR